MNKKGFFALLTAAMAGAWETVVTQLKATFRYRVAGGADNDDLPESNGRAVINTIYGNTVKWNQLAKELSSSNYTTFNAYATATYNNRIATITSNTTVSVVKGIYLSTFSPIVNHNYYISAYLDGTNSTRAVNLRICDANGEADFGISVDGGDKRKVSIIGKLLNGTRFGVLLAKSTPINEYVTASNLMCIDLTNIFGTDAEIAAALGIQEADITTDTGVAAFEQWLALNVGTQDYYPYDEGSLISFKGTGVKSVGFNKWDEQWELGGYITTTGKPSSNTDKIRSKNKSPISVFPSTKYFAQNGGYMGTIRTALYVFFYDVNKKFISYTATQNTTFTTPSNCYYIKFFVNIDYGTTYNNDICINISNPDKNGTYEPYWSDEKPFDVTKVYGKLRGEGSLVQVFPDGMFEGLSDRFPEDYIEYSYGDMEAVAADKKIDLGDCAWSLVSGCSHTFETTIDITVAEAIGYTFSDEIDESDTTQDTLIGLVDGGSTKLALLDRSLSSTDLVDGHITALEGVDAVYYHPNVDYYLNLVYRDNGTDTPLEEIFPIKYKVDKYSTEEVLVPTGDAPTSTSMIADIEYQSR